MQKCCSNASGLLKVAVVIVLLSVILHVIGFGTPFWSERLNFSEGLWETCQLGVCTNSASDPISSQSWYQAAQAFAILSFLGAVATIVLLFVAVCVPCLARNKPILISTIVISFLTAVFIVIALTVYGVRGKVYLEFIFGDPFVVGFSFILFAISLFGYIFVALFVAIALNQIYMDEWKEKNEDETPGDAEKGEAESAPEEDAPAEDTGAEDAPAENTETTPAESTEAASESPASE